MTSRRRFLGGAIGASTAAAWPTPSNAVALETAIGALADAPLVRVVTELDLQRRAGLVRVCIEGAAGRDLMMAVRERGYYTFGGFQDAPDGVYISPNLFNTADQLRGFARAIRDLARSGVPASKSA